MGTFSFTIRWGSDCERALAHVARGSTATVAKVSLCLISHHFCFPPLHVAPNKTLWMGFSGKRFMKFRQLLAGVPGVTKHAYKRQQQSPALFFLLTLRADDEVQWFWYFRA
jgi:hypothetical protein